jgi:hypothetical protein
LGSGFTGLVELPGGAKLTVQVFAGFEEVQCVLERIEASDLVDIAAVLERVPRMNRVVRRAVAAQDALLLVERLLGWTDESIREDLRAYHDVEPADAIAMRDELLALVRSEGGG